mmetsp:Transcript_53163/g.124531  ORF Transcript_53163/g.124531 Transcript_53163/m.124531 type:complete len:220 (+) Transcript_53163:650-1309(+)
MFALARFMPNYFRLFVEETLDFQQAVITARAVRASSLSQHQSFPTHSLHLLLLPFQVCHGFAPLVGMYVYVGQALQPFVGLCQAGFKPSWNSWCIKDDIPHCFPVHGRAGTVLDDAHEVLEPAAPQEELAIQSKATRQLCKEEARWTIDSVPQSGDKVGTIPVCTHAIELLAHQPASWVNLAHLPLLGQQHATERDCCPSTSRCAWSCWNNGASRGPGT